MLTLLPLQLTVLFHNTQLTESVKTLTLQFNVTSLAFHLANRFVLVFTALC